jgi:hypothetical protein
MAMGDISILGLGAYTRTHDRYGNLLSRLKPVEEPAPVPEDLPPAEETPAPAPTPTVELSPYAGFGGVISAMGMDMFSPPGTSAADTINQTLKDFAPYILNPELASQLIGNQTQEPPAQDAVDAAMAALSQNYDTSDPVALFKQIQIPGAGQIQPADLHRAVARGGGTYEQSAALMKQLDPFGNGTVTVQQLMANLPDTPGAEPLPEPAPATTPATHITDDTAIGGLGALAKTYDVARPLDAFAQLDSDFDGLVTEADIVNAVVANGGSAQAGAALYAQIDPARSGAVAQAQFMDNLFPRIELPNIFV